MKNSISPVRPHVVFAALLFGFLLGACTRPAPTPQRVEPPTLLPTPVVELETTAAYPPPPTDDLAGRATAYPPPPTLTSSPSPTFGPSPTPTPTPTPYPTYPPPPTLIPTLDSTTLPDRLRAALTLQMEERVNGHILQRVTGWEYGFRPSNYCADGPYRWLDESHLLLYPITGEEEGMGVSEFTLPVVMNLNDGQAWLPPTNGPTPSCDAPLWSEALQTLIATTVQEVVLLKPDGTVAQHFAGGAPLYYSSYLSPSGRRLVTGLIWRDLETGQTADFSGQHDFGKYEQVISNPGWSSDEKRLFNCCFSSADVGSGQFTVLNFSKLELPGRDGPGPGAPRWVLDDARVMIEFDLYEGGTSVIPLIDPAAQTYSDVRLLASLGENTSCGAPRVAPDGEHIVVACSAPSGSLNLLSSQTQLEAATIEGLLGGPALGPLYLINLRTFFTQTLPAGWGFVNWAPDSQFILLARNYDSETQSSEYALLPIAGGDLYSVSETPILSPAWSQDGRLLAYLSEDGRAAVTLEAATHASRLTLLPRPSIGVIWGPHSDQLAALAEDGSLWWIPDPTIDYAEQLTSPLPNVRDVRWSPSGTHLAFASGVDVYVVGVTQN